MDDSLLAQRDHEFNGFLAGIEVHFTEAKARCFVNVKEGVAFHIENKIAKRPTCK
jgi:hypothetical protein